MPANTRALQRLGREKLAALLPEVERVRLSPAKGEAWAGSVEVIRLGDDVTTLEQGGPEQRERVVCRFERSDYPSPGNGDRLALHGDQKQDWSFEAVLADDLGGVKVQFYRPVSRRLAAGGTRRGV